MPELILIISYDYVKDGVLVPFLVPPHSGISEITGASSFTEMKILRDKILI